MTRNRLVLATAVALGLLGCARPPEPADAGIVALDAVALRAEIAAGRVSALQATQAYLRRIAALDDAGPALAAVIEVNPEAEAIARGLDERQRAGAALGTLHGVPVLLKANIDTGDGMATSAGSLALAQHRARADADIVKRLRDAGAVVLGKTNLSEWAHIRSLKSTSGWSSLGGQTRNPYVLDRNPCGSSSGSAVAVAARLAPLAVGTETDGSIMCPAGVNGVVAIKPASGAVSQRGIVPLAHSQDTAGPFARTVADAALLLGVLSARGRSDELGTTRDATGLRVGVLRIANSDTAVQSAVAQALRWLESANVELVDPVQAELPSAAREAEMVTLLGEFRDDLNAYLAGVDSGPQSLDALIEFNEAHAAEVMPHFGQELMLAARDNGGTASSAYDAARETAAAARATLAALFAERELDALIAPTNSRAWRTNHATGDSGGRVSSSSIAAFTGYPNITVPVQLAAELPLGVSLIGKPGEESALLVLAETIERARGPFPEPRFLTSVGD